MQQARARCIATLGAHSELRERLGTGGDAEGAIDVLQVRMNGPGADPEQAPDRPIVVPGGDELQDTTLAGGQQRCAREGKRRQRRRFA